MELVQQLPVPYSLNVLVLDDHPVFRHGLVDILQEMHFIKRVEEACTVNEAMLLIARSKVDIVLLDLSIPDKDGLDFLTELKAKELKYRPKVIVISSHKEASKVIGSYELGIRGYILKDTPVREIRRALITVAEDETYFSEPVGKLILGHLVKNKSPKLNKPILSDKELEVLKLICQGMKNRQIADVLSRSVKTIMRHRNSLHEKLEVTNSVELMKYAISNGIVRI